jgi:hypothetical protein
MPAIASFIVPGLGQLTQGRQVSAAFFFAASVVIWWLCSVIGLWFLAGVANIGAAVNAATWSGRSDE